MLPAETTVLFHFNSIRIIFLIFHSIVISLLTITTSQCDFYSHGLHLLRLSCVFFWNSFWFAAKNAHKKKDLFISIKNCIISHTKCQEIFLIFLKGFDFLNNLQNTMVHYRIKSTPKSQKKPLTNTLLPVICTAALMISAISVGTALSASSGRRKKRRFII